MTVQITPQFTQYRRVSVIQIAHITYLYHLIGIGNFDCTAYGSVHTRFSAFILGDNYGIESGGEL